MFKVFHSVFVSTLQHLWNSKCCKLNLFLLTFYTFMIMETLVFDHNTTLLMSIFGKSNFLSDIFSQNFLLTNGSIWLWFAQPVAILNITFVYAYVFQFRNVYNFISNIIIWNCGGNTLNLSIILLIVLILLTSNFIQVHLHYSSDSDFLPSKLQLIGPLIFIKVSLTTAVMFDCEICSELMSLW